MAARSEAYTKFIASMEMDFDTWHDGTGYDLEALGQLEGAERQEVEKLLLRRAGSDWRDKEALAALGSKPAIAALKSQFEAGRTLRDRVDAAAELLELGKLDDVAPVLSEALRVDGDFSVFSRAMDLIGWHKVIATLPALLAVAEKGPGDKAVHAAAMACFLQGITEEPFDWDLRPFFLRFNEGDAERRKAYAELLEKLGQG